MAHSVSMEKALQKRKEEQEREAARKAMFRRKETYWKPKAGTNRFRLLPPWTDKGPNADQFWREIYQHFGVTCFDAPDPSNAFSVTCPAQTHGTAELLGLEKGTKVKCPICEAVAKLRNSQDPADVEMSKTSRAKQRMHSNIIDLNDPTWTQDAINALKAKNTPEEHLPKLGDPKVQIYTYGVTIMQMVLDFFQDGEDVTNLQEGRDLILERDGEGIQTKYRLRPDMNRSPAPITDKQLPKYLEDLDKLSPFFSTDQMDAILQGATTQEVFAMGRPAETEELPEGEKEEAVGELPAHEESAAEETEEQAEAAPEEPEKEEAKPEDWPPLDEDGDIDYEKLSDEDIENPKNLKVEDANGNTVHINCYGVARQIDMNSDDCKEGCGLFDRCVVRNKQLDEQEAAAKKKKGAGKKKKAGGKKAAGKGNNSGKKAPPKEEPAASGGAEDDLEAEMRAALGK